MLKKILAFGAVLCATASFAAVELNTASAGELEGVKGIGPSLSTKIMNERQKGEFKDWADFIARVKGVGDKSAARLSGEGMTVNGKSHEAVGAPVAEKKTDK